MKIKKKLRVNYAVQIAAGQKDRKLLQKRHVPLDPDASDFEQDGKQTGSTEEGPQLPGQREETVHQS